MTFNKPDQPGTGGPSADAGLLAAPEVGRPSRGRLNESKPVSRNSQAAGRTRPRSDQWNAEQIRRARRVKLPPILEERGYPLRPMTNGNFLVEDTPGLVVKEHYWVWNDRGMQGNAIDFFMIVECRSFNETMLILSDHDRRRGTSDPADDDDP